MKEQKKEQIINCNEKERHRVFPDGPTKKIVNDTVYSVKVVVQIPKQMYLNAKTDTLCGADILINAIKNGIPLPKGYGDLIDRSKLEVCSIDITDLPKDKGLMVYYAEDVDEAPAIIKADNESEAAEQ